MKKIWMAVPFLVLTFVLFLPKRVDAQTAPISALSASDVVTEVNALRASKDLPLYEVNSILMTIAQEQADYMAETGVLKHFGPDGSRPYQRALAAGYPVAGDLTFGGLFSENIHAAADLSPAEVVAIWQTDPNDLETMISADFMDIGVGLASENGISYYVLDVGTSTGGSDTGSATFPPGLTSTRSSGTQPAIVLTTTPIENGSVYHVVQPEEALWSIALAYDTTVDELKKINRLPSDAIFVGQKLLILEAEKITATPAATITVTLGIPTSTATRPMTPTITSTPTPLPTPPASGQSGGVIVGGIVVIAAVAAGLGAWLGRKKSA